MEKQTQRIDLRTWGEEGEGEMYGKSNMETYIAAATKSLQLCPTLCDPIEATHQAPPSLGFSRQEYWSGVPFPSPMHESEK